MKYNACIQILSSRQECLKRCLLSIHQKYNYRYNYPVYVHYFDDIYDSEKYRSYVHENISANIYFVPVLYRTPKHIVESDLFYNKNLWYAKTRFSIRRKGYLHMCHFINNMYKYPGTRLHEYDYIMVYDDEAGYEKELPYDPVEILSKRSEDMGALIVGQRLKDGKPHQGHLDTRVGLWEFTKKFLLENGIEPKSQLLKNLMIDENAEKNFHYLPWADTYVIKTKMFEIDLWKKWITAVNENGGVYKYRWGDNEIMSIFYLIYDDKLIYNFKAVEEGYYNQGMFRETDVIAPNVKNVNI